ncbi:hypothetical protein L9Z41_17225 [Leptospira noguchii]|uniref:hypothetical protein n=1 Tax=Leptospira noguchii TaxID=28182 RepID=UPI001F06E433|nr:hypothetical protein [Leptospira noguchii]MCH1911846.1 hypothetical protein [Leptospira noguchii]MCH1917323.1 hypothetical protein [Leptospira noguchii]UOG63004.1 hypothetical protein MAL04_11360 [Leptospira noguchii]
MKIVTKRKTSRRRRQSSKLTDFDELRNESPAMPYLAEIENPFSGLSESKVNEILAEMQLSSIKSIEDSIVTLNEIIKTNNPLIALSIITHYALNASLGENKVESRGYFEDVGQPHVELFQALILKVNKIEWGLEPVTPNVVQEIFEKLSNLISSYPFLRINQNSSDLPVSEREIIEFQETIRNHTTSIRNWGYYSQVKRIISELYSPFENSVRNKFGFSIEDVISVFDQMVSECEKRMNERYTFLKDLQAISKKEDLIRKYCETKGEDSIEEINLLLHNPIVAKSNRKDLFVHILVYEDQNIIDLYYFSQDDLARDCSINVNIVKSIFEYFSFSPGEIENYENEYLFLNNPIWEKPIIKINGKYFCSMPQILFSNSIPILDLLVEVVDKAGLNSRRAKYLEKKVEEIVNNRFPESLTASNLKWKDKDQEFETDLITFIDSYAIIIEAKSHKVSASALRGGRERIKRHIKDLIITPSQQSKRLSDRIKELISNPNIRDELRSKLPVGLNKIHKIIRISVSLEDFATMQSNISRFKLTGWIPDTFVPCPTLNLADFETVFDILEHPVQILHYFERRSELELDESVEIVGDELDYLGFYLSTLFSQGRIQETSKDSLVLSAMSKIIDDYYTLKDAGYEVSKPMTEVSELFKNIFIKLEKRSVHRWTEIGSALNRFNPVEQDKISKFIKKLELQAANNWYSQNLKNILIYAPPKGVEYGLAYVIYNNETFHRRKEFIESATSQIIAVESVQAALIIAKNVDFPDSPFDYIALVDNIER